MWAHVFLFARRALALARMSGPTLPSLAPLQRARLWSLASLSFRAVAATGAGAAGAGAGRRHPAARSARHARVGCVRLRRGRWRVVDGHGDRRGRKSQTVSSVPAGIAYDSKYPHLTQRYVRIWNRPCLKASLQSIRFVREFPQTRHFTDSPRSSFYHVGSRSPPPSKPRMRAPSTPRASIRTLRSRRGTTGG
jgi:hypothetical protein